MHSAGPGLRRLPHLAPTSTRAANVRENARNPANKRTRELETTHHTQREARDEATYPRNMPSLAARALTPRWMNRCLASAAIAQWLRRWTSKQGCARRKPWKLLRHTLAAAANHATAFAGNGERLRQCRGRHCQFHARRVPTRAMRTPRHAQLERRDGRTGNRESAERQTTDPGTRQGRNADVESGKAGKAASVRSAKLGMCRDMCCTVPSLAERTLWEHRRQLQTLRARSSAVRALATV